MSEQPTPSQVRLRAQAHCTIVQALFPWGRGSSAGQRRDLITAPVAGHYATLQLSNWPRNQGETAPVRWSINEQKGIVIRWPYAYPLSAPSAPLDRVLAQPVVERVHLKEGQSTTFSVRCVPQRSEPHHRGDPSTRGIVRPIVDDDEVAAWLQGRLAHAFRDIEITQLRHQMYSLEQSRGRLHAVQADIRARVADPLLAAQAMVGRCRAYGFGLPVF